VTIKPYLLTFALVVSIFHLAVSQTKANTSAVIYKGFSIKTSEKLDGVKSSRMLVMIKKHIDYLPYYVNEKMLELFKTVPILLSAPEDTKNPVHGPGAFGAGKLRIFPAILNFSPNKPVLLHEYMHAYHFKVLGTQNPDVIKYYEQAKASGIYPAGAYLLKNKQEFFAMAASTMLSGEIAREPFTREKLEKEMPECAAWLRKLLGIQED
jgi:hypothetical protein